MAHDVFISYSTKDKTIADAMCNILESKKIRCWIAPRDVQVGIDYAEALVNAIESSRLFVLIYSSNSNNSEHVFREIDQAAYYSKPIIPFRIENVEPRPKFSYFLRTVHWLDALNPPLEQHIQKLAEVILQILNIKSEATRLSPIVIGAAMSTADGYFTNFILRFWENIGDGFTDIASKEKFRPDISQIRMNIYMPQKIDDDLVKNICDYYETNEYKRGIIATGTFRGVEFRYKKTKDELIICDIPSTITVSYNTVNDILDLGVGESYDKAAEERFLTQERDSFYFCLNKLKTEKAIASKLKRFRSYLDKNGKENTERVQNMQLILKNQVNIETIDLNRG